MNELPDPLTPADCDLRNFREMPIDVPRLLGSDLVHDESPEACWSAMLLWCVSWHEVPAGSMPDNNEWLAKRAGYWHKGKLDPTWNTVREGALHGWIKCNDGRLYHPVLAEKVNAAWFSKHRHAHEKLGERVRKRNKTRAEKGQSPLEVPDLESWIDMGRPLERELFPDEFPAVSAGSKAASAGSAANAHRKSSVVPPEGKGDSAGIPPENTLNRTEQSGAEQNGSFKTIGTVIASGKPARDAIDDFRPKDAAEWLRHLRDKHGFEADPTNVNDRKKLWPVFAGWTNAGLTTAFVDAAIAAAIRDASEPIVCLPLYVDRCMANANAACASPSTRIARDERRRNGWAELTGAGAPERTAGQPTEVIDGHVKRIG
ncbi:TPA: DUF1376 domain-containing protein [Burkholderia multivorans]|nr:DUF1376 domain-containing protein [Burkholderia multivorans]HDR9840812.1 DUF1376 domain-containing protein [Burkholderia multivorans]HDR9847334.1 DUF1376 domain-containing protein [Burkholderia multivorans]HDR9853748.1 DUF1376 domain-containing protein [Burkholderia multivorans]